MAVAAAVEKAAAMRLEVGVTAAAVARRLMFIVHAVWSDICMPDEQA
jgi:hypothetical protein